MSKIILDLCGGTGSWSKPYKEAGYDVRLVTLPDDVRLYIPPENVYGILAAPPCTEFSIVKNHNIPRNIEDAMSIVNGCLKIIETSNPVWWVLENPRGLLSKYIGKPKYSFQPWWFGDGWTKHTCLWGKFNIPLKVYNLWEEVPKIPELYIRPGRKHPSIVCNQKSALKFIPQLKNYQVSSNAAFRAITPPGFAKAFFEANP